MNAFTFQLPGGEALARAFDVPFIVKRPDEAHSITGYASAQGATTTAVEMGGRSEDEGKWAEHIAIGLRRALAAAGVLSISDTAPPVTQTEVERLTVLRPSRGGILIPEVPSASIGTIVPGGTVLGHVVDPVTFGVIETFEAPFPQTALLLIRPTMTLLEGGAMTYVVAEPVGS
jgi:hypothetical protein